MTPPQTSSLAQIANPELPTVLVVDDELGPRESLRMILSPNHRVLTARGASEALEIFGTEDVDLVTVDLNMPGMKGDELMQIVRDDFPSVDVIIITGYGTLETAADAIRRGVCDYLTKPFDVVQVNAAVSRALERQQSRMRATRDEPALDGGRPEGPMAQPLARPRTVEFLEVLAETIESRDPGMRGHARRVAFYSGLIADRLCLTARKRDDLRIAAFLHDLGKVGLEPGVLPPDKLLSAEQRRCVAQHPSISERLVRPLGFSSAIRSAMRHHHERWDGSGYPDGMRAEDIPLAARIIAVADAYDVMVTERPYEGALDQAAALDELSKKAGSQFDPAIVSIFIAVAKTGVCSTDGPAVHEAIQRVHRSARVSAEEDQR